MGKTTVGDYLRDHYGYAHLNMEAAYQTPDDFIAGPGDNKVITRGFAPGISDRGAQYFQSGKGVKPWVKPLL